MNTYNLFDFDNTMIYHTNAQDTGSGTMAEIREQAVVYGVKPLTNRQLLSILTPEQEETVMAFLRLFAHDGLANLAGRSVAELTRYGIPESTALLLLAAVELGRRIRQESIRCHADTWSNPDTIADYVMEDMRHLRHEEFRAAYLDTQNQLIAIQTLGVGTIDFCTARERDVFRWALTYDAARVILLHNHPSGVAEPSREDITITQHIVRGGALVGVEVLDHIIIGDGTYYSLASQGYI